MEKRHIKFSPPDISDLEINEVIDTLRSGWITTGPKTKSLERRLAAYIETGESCIDTNVELSRWNNKVVCLNSATSAEELNLRVFGIDEDAEVLIPAYTYTSTASAAVHCGAKIKFVDIQKDGDSLTHSPEMDYDKLEKAITEKTKAIVAVDIAGIVCDYERIFDIVERKRNLFVPKNCYDTPLTDLSSKLQNSFGRIAVFSDCAHGLGASRVINNKQKYTGAIADFTSFSFHAVKNLTTGEGGAATWVLPPEVYESGVTDEMMYKMYQLLSLHGQNKDALSKTQVGSWEYDIIGPWYKCNMTDIMASIGLRQLDRYIGLLERRRQIINTYDELCDSLGIYHLNHHVNGMDSSNHLYFIRIPNIDESKRNLIISRMSDSGVMTNVHYKPLPMMTAYGKSCEEYPNAYDYYKNLITLPLHTLLSDEDLDYICDVLKGVLKEVIA